MRSRSAARVEIEKILHFGPAQLFVDELHSSITAFAENCHETASADRSTHAGSDETLVWFPSSRSVGNLQRCFHYWRSRSNSAAAQSPCCVGNVLGFPVLRRNNAACVENK
eukprot:6188077-Pleurochrysis_carterae.AAC.3